MSEELRGRAGSSPPADEPDERALAGTTQLAAAALSGPPPPPQAEEQSRARVLAHLEEAPGAPPALPDKNADGAESLARRVLRGVKRLWPR